MISRFINFEQMIKGIVESYEKQKRKLYWKYFSREIFMKKYMKR
jgi:hypothetical protein